MCRGMVALKPRRPQSNHSQNLSSNRVVMPFGEKSLIAMTGNGYESNFRAVGDSEDGETRRLHVDYLGRLAFDVFKPNSTSIGFARHHILAPGVAALGIVFALTQPLPMDRSRISGKAANVQNRVINRRLRTISKCIT